MMKYLFKNNSYLSHRLREEIDEMMATTSPENFYTDLDKMVYLEQVIKEVLRMYPIAVATTRTNYMDTNLGKHTIPAGSTLMVCILYTYGRYTVYLW